ncbi:MAG: hypothetical protein HC819_05270 [Cyclobacteriaceae bacterium]|nr:hypothetical protein [Cyclobacteriaceae bacterium]
MNDQESKTKKIIKDISDKIDELLEQSEISKDDVKKEINSRIQELKRSRDQINEEFRKIREDNKETIDKAEKMAKNTFKEVKTVLTGFFDKISREAEGSENKEGNKGK